MSYSRQWSENVQMHLCTFAMAHRELMHLCITLNGYTSATVVNITFSLMPVDSMHLSVHCGVQILHISAFMHFYHSTDNTVTDFNRTDRFRSDLPLGKLNCRVRQKVTPAVVFFTIFQVKLLSILMKISHIFIHTCTHYNAKLVRVTDNL